MTTYWNGQPTRARRVRVRVGSVAGAPPLSWWIGLEGTERNAVEVTYAGTIFYLDDDDVPPEVEAAQAERLARLPDAERARIEGLLRIVGPQPPGRAGRQRPSTSTWWPGSRTCCGKWAR